MKRSLRLEIKGLENNNKLQKPWNLNQNVSYTGLVQPQRLVNILIKRRLAAGVFSMPEF